MADTTFSAAVERVDGLQMRATVRGMEVTFDEPPELGGTDTGMNPVEGILASLGACQCIVASAFAQAKGIRLGGIRVEVDGILDPDGFLGRNPDAKVGFSSISTRYHIDADNTPEEIAAFVDFIEHTCPVHDTLVNPALLSYEIA